MTDRDDKRTSSDDLVRRAREGLYGEEDSGTSDSHDAVESSIDPSSGDSGSLAEEYAEFLRETSGTPEEQFTTTDSSIESEVEPVAPAATPPEPPTPTRLSDDELESSWGAAPAPSSETRSWDPTWTPESGSDGYGGGAPVGGPDPSVLPEARPAPQRSGGSPRFGGWIIGLVIFGGIALFNVLDNTTNVAALSTGDCIEDPGIVAVIENVESVSCAEPHEVEVFAVADLTGPGTADGSRYPGEDEIYESGMEVCVPRFTGYVGSSYESSVYWIDAWTPVEEGWDDGDREVLCVLYEFTDDFDLKTSTFSARNSGR